MERDAWGGWFDGPKPSSRELDRSSHLHAAAGRGFRNRHVKKLTEMADSWLPADLSLAPESLLSGRTHLNLNLLSSVIATPMPCRMPRTCFMTSVG